MKFQPHGEDWDPKNLLKDDSDEDALPERGKAFLANKRQVHLAVSQREEHPPGGNLWETFNEYIKRNNVKLPDFWKSAKVLIPPEEFRTFFSDIKYRVSPDDFQALLKDITSNEGVVILELFCKKTPVWQPNLDDFKEEIKERALRFEAQKRGNQFRIKSGRPQSSSVGTRPLSGPSRPYSGVRPISGVSTISYKSKGTQGSEYPLVTDNAAGYMSQIPVDNTKKYLKKAKEKEKEMDKLLNLAVMKGKNEKEYEALVKMGEANEISQSIGSTITYRAFRSPDGTLRCHVYDLDKFVKEMTLEEMTREYKVIKQNQKLASNKPIWESLHQEGKGGVMLPKDVIAAQKDKKRGASPEQKSTAKDGAPAKSPPGGPDTSAKNAAVINRKERQNEIKQVLAETMELTNTLKYQLKILEKRGINLQGTNLSASLNKLGGTMAKGGNA